MLLREASTLLGKRSDEENEDEEKDHEPKIVSVPAFSSQYCIAKDVDRVLRGKGTKKCVLLMYEKTYEYLNSVKSRCYGYLAFEFFVWIPSRGLMNCAFIIPSGHPIKVCFDAALMVLIFRALYLIMSHVLLLYNICKAQRSGHLQIRLKD
ncbi:hypothetical protein QR680_010888 [Steinernema hermaphroditum]|uniref:Uncharacterized protein n=1 Tax=Steinernema hermaphroditum TaxID=289476 RepID=A0AA39IQF5_9BILA|nr:hypothetical protein QR680_010888 [Steinernema hermaphroditum]